MSYFSPTSFVVPDTNSLTKPLLEGSSAPLFLSYRIKTTRGTIHSSVEKDPYLRPDSTKPSANDSQVSHTRHPYREPGEQTTHRTLTSPSQDRESVSPPLSNRSYDTTRFTPLRGLVTEDLGPRETSPPLVPSVPPTTKGKKRVTEVPTSSILD